MEIPFPKSNPFNFNLNKSNQDGQLTQEQLLQYLQKNPDLLQKELDKIALKYKPINSDEYEKLDNLEKYLDEDGGIMIEPTPRFVFKTLDKHSEKVFLNITQHPVIDEPEEKYLVEMENSPGLRIPMSVGRVKEDADKKGEICKVIDLVLNPNVTAELLKDASMQTFFIELIKSYILEKHKIELVGKFNMLKMKYKGKSIEFQRVKGKKSPKIKQMNSEEVKFDAENTKVLKENKQYFFDEDPKQILQPEFKVFFKYEDGKEEEYDGDINFKEISFITFVFSLPLLRTGRHIILEINQDELHLKNAKIYEIFLKIPVKVKESQTKAEFDPAKKELRVEIQVENVLKEALTKVDQENITNSNEKKGIKNNIEMKTNLLYDIV